MGEVIKIYSILDPDSGQCSSNDEAEGGMLGDKIHGKKLTESSDSL
jgi:hypothetical protein